MPLKRTFEKLQNDLNGMLWLYSVTSADNNTMHKCERRCLEYCHYTNIEFKITTLNQFAVVVSLKYFGYS